MFGPGAGVGLGLGGLPQRSSFVSGLGPGLVVGEEGRRSGVGWVDLRTGVSVRRLRLSDA